MKTLNNFIISLILLSKSLILYSVRIANILQFSILFLKTYSKEGVFNLFENTAVLFKLH